MFINMKKYKKKKNKIIKFKKIENKKKIKNKKKD
jgi:hypothetical protein